MINALKVIGRSTNLFESDLKRLSKELERRVFRQSFLVLGGAGSIGRAVVKELYKRAPNRLHVVDLSENSLAELVRDLRSDLDWAGEDFSTYAIDIGSDVYDKFFFDKAPYDYVLNLSALKHVRSEKDPDTLLRMIDTNIFNTVKTIRQCDKAGVKKYFCVSTDKAANPVNLMGASKKIMELCVASAQYSIPVSSARFANVAFSAGSLLESFQYRIHKRQPIVVPSDVERYFVTEEEAGQLCVLSCLFAADGEIYFPKPDKLFRSQTFEMVVERFLTEIGYTPKFLDDVSEARALAKESSTHKVWPVIRDVSDTTGEKPYEEFFTDKEDINLEHYEAIGVVESRLREKNSAFSKFEDAINAFRGAPEWNKAEIVRAFETLLPAFRHVEKFKNLDEKI